MFSKEAVGTGTADRSSRNICSSAARGRLDSWRVAAPPPVALLLLPSCYIYFRFLEASEI